MNKERLVWWLFFAAFVLFIVLMVTGIFALTPFIAANPEVGAFLIGFIIFWLFANRLIFGYGAIADVSNALYKEEEAKLDKEEIAKKTGKPIEELEHLSEVSIIMLWKGYLEPFKYALFLGFALVFSFALLFGLNIVTSLTVAPIAEGFMLGAAIPGLIVWIMELIADYYVAALIKRTMAT
jgi:hypothetical protein